MNLTDANSFAQRISELELSLEIETAKQQLISEYCNCGIWEYDIPNKRCIQTRKLDGKWQSRNLTVENFRDTMLRWGRIHPHDIGIFENFCDSMDRGDKNIAYELRSMTDDSRFIWIRYVGTTLFDKEGTPVRVVGKTLDITKEKYDEEFNNPRLMQDSLTKLYTWDACVELIEKSLGSAAETTGCGVLMLIDLDDFKRINDTWGNLYGDSILQSAASIIYTNFSSTDIVGRIRGDEFIVYCPDISTETEAVQLASRLIFRVHNFVELKDNSVLGVSIGISLFPRDASDFDVLYRNADYALYAAKQNGKNCYSFFQKKPDAQFTAGETVRKKKLQSGEIPSTKQLSNIEKDLFDYSFEVLSQSSDFLSGLNKIFAEIGLFFSLDRITLIEYRPDKQTTFITSCWKREDDGNDIEYIAQSCKKNWAVEEKFYAANDYCIIRNGISQIHDISGMKEHLTHFPKSLIQFPVMDGVHLAGTITFESWYQLKSTSTSELATLFSITKMLSSYILRLRSKKELETEILYTGKAMDMQKLAYYAIDSESHDLTFISRYASESFPGIRLGEKCYRAIRNSDIPCPDCPALGLSESCSQCSTEIFKESTDSWHTITVSKLRENKQYGMTDNQYLICWTDVTAFLDRVKSTDQLTGTLSYDKFRVEALRRIMIKKKSYSIVFTGIKDFSHINDEYGFSIGDEVLRLFASSLKNSLSDDELICRIKGDDFVLLLEQSSQISTKDRSLLIAQPFNALVRSKYPHMNILCFGGIYDIHSEDYSISNILDKAGKARKVALNNYYQYQGIYIYCDEYARQEESEAEMERHMMNAMHSGSYTVYFQPKVNLKTGKIAGAEALIRLLDSNGSIISPAKFIPLAEKSGFVTEIDKVVYDKTMHLIQQWTAAGKIVPLISVNVSRLNLFHDDLGDYLQFLLNKYNLNSSQIELEITESVFFDDTSRLINAISRLKRSGFLISMDDFGSGFSTLSLMKSLPLDILKIDGSFFLQNKLDSKNKAVISAIIHLAKSLGFQIVSEGIETKEQADFAREQGSDQAQGYYFYKPMPAEEFEKLLETDENG